MAEPYIGEIKIVAFPWAQQGWAKCDGQLLPISQNQTLFALLGTIYGGDGRSNFKLPDLRGRTPVHTSDEYGLRNGQFGGTESMFLSVNTMPQHNHLVNTTIAPANKPNPGNNQNALIAPLTLSSGANASLYGDATSLTALKATTIGNTGCGLAWSIMQPYNSLCFVIALQGLFPPRN